MTFIIIVLIISCLKWHHNFWSFIGGLSCCKTQEPCEDPRLWRTPKQTFLQLTGRFPVGACRAPSRSDPAWSPPEDTRLRELPPEGSTATQNRNWLKGNGTKLEDVGGTFNLKRFQNFSNNTKVSDSKTNKTSFVSRAEYDLRSLRKL